MKLTYWVAPCLNDAPCYSVRAKTRKAVLARLEEQGGSYGPPEKVTFEYADAFDLIDLFTQEGGPAETY
jgi:hypothetical protein